MSRRFGIGILIGATFLAVIAIAEGATRLLYGLGNPVLYDAHPFYGYRLKPNQSIRRFRGAEIRVNNLGLRADEPWTVDGTRQVLFLGDSVTYGGSYVSNDQLFSSLAVRDLPGFRWGNAGVNGWGVDNVHGLVVKHGFMPAGIYVTVLPEGDFYRGLTRINGVPFWSRKPAMGLQEVLYFWLDRITSSRYVSWIDSASGEERQAVANESARKLREMHDLLISRGKAHLIYVSPTEGQALHGRPRDPVVASALRAAGIRPTYIQDRLRAVDRARIEGAYHDSVHLTAEGHRLWAAFIAEDLAQLVRQRQ